MSEKRVDPELASPRNASLVPGNWNANPLTCRILRNAGFSLPKSSAKDDPVRT